MAQVMEKKSAQERFTFVPRRLVLNECGPKYRVLLEPTGLFSRMTACKL